MDHVSNILTSSMIQELIKQFREGHLVHLVCTNSFGAFTIGDIYTVDRVSAGTALLVTDDTGAKIAIDEDHEGVGLFASTIDPQEAEDISMILKGNSARKLARGVVELSKINKFAVGDLITWKDGCQISQFPAAGAPAVVMEILESPKTVAGAHPLDPMSTLICDLIIGFEIADGSITTSHADSRRFEKYEIQIARLADRMNLTEDEGSTNA